MREGYTVPTTSGRSVLVRPGYQGETVQLAIVSTYGNIIESVSLDSAQLRSVVGALSKAQEQAERDFVVALKRSQAEAEVRYKDALARNPWLSEARKAREARGLV